MLQKKKQLLSESISNTLKIVCNPNHISCRQFYDHVKADSSLLKKQWNLLVIMMKLQNIKGLNLTNKDGLSYFSSVFCRNVRRIQPVGHIVLVFSLILS